MGETQREYAERINLPLRPFLYTLDQLAVLLDIEVNTLKTSYLYFDGRSTGVHRKPLMYARNIAEFNTDKPDWRVAESEFIRWLKFKGYKFYETGRVTR